MSIVRRFGDKVGAEVYLDGDRATVEDVFTVTGYSADVRAEVVEAFDLLRWALSSSSDERVVACMGYYHEIAYLADRLFDQQRDNSFVKVGYPVTDCDLEEVTQEDWRQLGEDLRNLAPGGKSVRISPTLCRVLARPEHAHHP